MESTLVRLFEHNNWANLELIEACSRLSAKELDAQLDSLSSWSLRETLIHLVEAQQGYLSLLTLPPEAREPAHVAFDELLDAARQSGAALQALAHNEASTHARGQLHTTDGYVVEPWVVLLQAINHATDHRRQISRMLRSLGSSPPRIDGWAFGESVHALLSPKS